MRATICSCVGLLALAVLGCGSDSSSFRAEQYDGRYEGTWTNETTKASGPVSIDIHTDAKASTASLTIDFGGNYLGLGDPPPAELTGSVSAKGAAVKGVSALFGDYDVTIDADGKIIGLMRNVGGGAVPELSYTGTVTSTRLDADYTVTMGDGTKVQSLLRMTKKA